MTLQSFLSTTYGLQTQKFVSVQGGVVNINTVCTTSTGSFLIKQYTVKRKEQILFEVGILKALENAAFPSPRLLPSLTGEYVTHYEDRPCLVYEHIPGKQLREITPDMLQQVGACMARLHGALQHYMPPVQKPGWDPEALLALITTHGHELATRGFPQTDELLAFITTELKKYRFPDDLPAGVTHQDIKPENIIVESNRVRGIVDFDNAYVGALLHDLTTTLIWTCFTNSSLQKNCVQALLEGYEQHRPLTRDERELLGNAIAWRLLREMFIGPYAALDPRNATERTSYFKQLYLNFNPATFTL